MGKLLNGKFRDEWLSHEIFDTLLKTKVSIDRVTLGTQWNVQNVKAMIRIVYEEIGYTVLFHFHDALFAIVVTLNF